MDTLIRTAVLLTAIISGTNTNAGQKNSESFTRRLAETKRIEVEQYVKMKQEENRNKITAIQPQGLTVEAISVNTLKITWADDPNDERKGTRDYDYSWETSEAYLENIYSFSTSKTCVYLTGLRENGTYNITVTPKVQDGESLAMIPATAVGKTETVTVIQEYEYEEGWTGCFAGERASGLTAYPSAPAIAGSYADDITGTGIRRKPNGDYCCAMGLWYGVVGDRFLVELENGNQFTVQICDSKGWGDDADGDEIPDGRFHWFGGVGNGKCVVEFIYDDYNLPSSVAFYGSWGIANWNGLNLCSDIASIKKINY